MIRWCAYCQRFMDEVPPFDRFGVTHSICAPCDARGGMTDREAIRRVRPIAEFFVDLARAAASGSPLPSSELLNRADELGISPADLLVGLIGPALYEIGQEWAAARVTVAAEHRFSATVEEVVAVLRSRAAAPEPRCCDVLLVNAPGNVHTLGVRIGELYAQTHGIDVVAVTPGIPVAEIAALAARLQPRVIGISASMVDHLPALNELAEVLEADRSGEGPRLVLGGRVVKERLIRKPPRGFELAATLPALQTFVGLPAAATP